MEIKVIKLKKPFEDFLSELKLIVIIKKNCKFKVQTLLVGCGEVGNYLIL